MLIRVVLQINTIFNWDTLYIAFAWDRAVDPEFNHVDFITFNLVTITVLRKI